MKVAIIGAGISGISASKLLNEKSIESKVFESNEKNGGLISCDLIDDVLFHKVGGHVFNTKDEEVKKWFFKYFNLKKEFTNAHRNSKIEIKNNLIDYPIENHIYQLPEEIGKNIISELLEFTEIDNSNFEKYLKSSFGKTLFELYFKPYNQKIWKKNLKKISVEWLKNKLPMPDKLEIILNNIYKKKEYKMAHSTFYYPVKGGSQFIVDRLSTGLNINNNCKVKNIKKVKNSWLIENEHFTHVIYTGNIKYLNRALENIKIPKIKNEDFQSHGTTTVLCTVKNNDLSWLYLPENYTRAHRIIMTGNFSKFNNGNYDLTATLEFSEKLDMDSINNEVKKINWIDKVLKSHYKDESYIIHGPNTKQKVKELKNNLSSHNFHLLGRFAEWEYYNMDNAIRAAMNLINKIC